MIYLNPVGLTRTPKHAYYWNAEGPIASVTTIIGILDKSGPLVGWAKREVASCAIRNLDTLAAMRAIGGDAAAVEWLKKIPDFQRDTAADVGSTVHALAEATSRDQEVVIPDEIAPFLAGFRQWRTDYQPRYLAAEEMIVSLKHGYAGTLDAIVEIEGETWLIDYKSSKGVYAEAGLQLAAYGHAEFIGRPGIARKFRIPRATRYGVVHLRPEGYAFREFAVDAGTFKAFLAAKALYDWSTTSKGIVGEPLTPRNTEAAA